MFISWIISTSGSNRDTNSYFGIGFVLLVHSSAPKNNRLFFQHNKIIGNPASVPTNRVSNGRTGTLWQVRFQGLDRHINDSTTGSIFKFHASDALLWVPVFNEPAGSLGGDVVVDAHIDHLRPFDLMRPLRSPLRHSPLNHFRTSLLRHIRLQTIVSLWLATTYHARMEWNHATAVPQPGDELELSDFNFYDFSNDSEFDK
jgi:hypothetical protein